MERLRRWRRRKSGGAPRLHNEVSVAAPSGCIWISRAFEEHFGNAKYASLYYDEENKVIGIKPEPDRTPGSYKICKSRHCYSPFIVSKSIISFLKIKTGRYPALWNEKLGMLLFEYEVKAGSTHEIREG